MENEQHLISVEEFCTYHQIELAFVKTLNDFGLLTVTMIKTGPHIYSDQMKELEKMVRLHYDLGINVEGIQAITHLLQRVDNLHEELSALKSRLSLYNPEDESD